MISIKRILFFTFYICISAVLAVNPSKKPKENEESRKLKAESADKHIRFITPAEFTVHADTGLWIIMYGANWCKYTQRLTPKWLGLQTRIRAENLSHDINIAKVECTKSMDFCTSQGVEGFPTIYVYENGNKIEEYLGNHEINEMFTYVQEQIARYKSDEVVEEIVTVYVDESEYQEELEKNKPRKSSNQQNNNQKAPSKEEMMKNKPSSKNPPKQKNSKNPPVENKEHKRQQPPKRNNQKPQPPKRNIPKQQQKPTRQQVPNKQQHQRNMPPKHNNIPKQPQYRRPLPPKKPNVVVRATKSVFGLMESIILLVVVLVVVYAIFRFRAIKNRSSYYSKSKIPLYRDLTQEEKFMLHYS